LQQTLRETHNDLAINEGYSSGHVTLQKIAKNPKGFISVSISGTLLYAEAVPNGDIDKIIFLYILYNGQTANGGM
jgi:hypothetical protein